MDYQEDISPGVRAVVSTTLSVEPEKVTGESRLQEDLDADSLDGVEVVMAVEEKFGVVIPEDAAEAIKTVDDLARFVASAKQAKLSAQS